MRAMMIVSLLGFVASAAVAEVPAIPQTPAAVNQVVSIQPFKLGAGETFHWLKDRPTYEEGFVVVLDVNPALVFPRQVEEPVLYVGGTTAERVNQGNNSGRVVAIVPADVESFDWSQALVFFGTPMLPERVDAATISAEQGKAAAAGIRPLTREQLKTALAAGGELVTVEDRFALNPVLAAKVQAHSPAESELIQSLEMPKLR